MSGSKRVLVAFVVCWIPLASAAVAQEPGGKARADAPLKSGPPVGAANDRDGFRPQYVAGPGAAGRSLCPV
jgi:hypothetical protein